MNTRTVSAENLANGMEILEVNGTPLPAPFVVGKVREAFGLPWARRRYNIWSTSDWPGGPPDLTLVATDRVKVRTAV